MKPEHERATKIALSSVEDRGFALAGGNALSAHGIGDRQSDDIDLFTDRMDENIGTTVERLQAAFEAQGYSAEIVRQRRTADSGQGVREVRAQLRGNGWTEVADDRMGE